MHIELPCELRSYFDAVLVILGVILHCDCVGLVKWCDAGKVKVLCTTTSHFHNHNWWTLKCNVISANHTIGHYSNNS